MEAESQGVVQVRHFVSEQQRSEAISVGEYQVDESTSSPRSLAVTEYYRVLPPSLPYGQVAK